MDGHCDQFVRLSWRSWPKKSSRNSQPSNNKKFVIIQLCFSSLHDAHLICWTHHNIWTRCCMILCLKQHNWWIHQHRHATQRTTRIKQTSEFTHQLPVRDWLGLGANSLARLTTLKLRSSRRTRLNHRLGARTRYDITATTEHADIAYTMFH